MNPLQPPPPNFPPAPRLPSAPPPLLRRTEMIFASGHFIYLPKQVYVSLSKQKIENSIKEHAEIKIFHYNILFKKTQQIIKNCRIASPPAIAFFTNFQSIENCFDDKMPRMKFAWKRIPSSISTSCIHLLELAGPFLVYLYILQIGTLPSVLWEENYKNSKLECKRV